VCEGFMGKKFLVGLLLSLLLTEYSFADAGGVALCSALFQIQTRPQNVTVESNNLLQGRLQEVEQLKDKELQAAIYSIFSTLLQDKSRRYPSVFDDMTSTRNLYLFIEKATLDMKHKPDTASLPSSKIKEGIMWVITRGFEDFKELQDFIK
jgi:hypothetical protein